MDNDRFNPSPPEETPEPSHKGKDPYAEPPMKDFTHLLNGQPVTAKASHTGRTVLIAVIVIILLVAGFGGYWYFVRHSHKSTPPPKTAQSSSQHGQQAKGNAPAAIPTSSFTSASFKFTVKYPKTWTVTDGGTASVSITSPQMQLTAASGQTVSGKVIVLVQPKGKVPSAFGSSSVAVLPSQLMSYSNPTSSQRAQTYLSFVQYPSTTTLGALDGIYITGNYGYQKDQAIPGTDVANLDPLVTVTFGQCSGTNCTSLSPLSITAGSWSDSSFNAPILTILKSFAFS